MSLLNIRRTVREVPPDPNSVGIFGAAAPTVEVEETSVSPTFFGLVIVLIVITLARVIADPWTSASSTLFYNSTGLSPDSSSSSILFAILLTLVVINFLFIVDYFALIPGGSADRLVF
jgi:hypothetical protein|nr:hypothetical protein pmam_24 [Pithovirus mammoth]